MEIKYTNHDAVNIIEDEGLGYAVQHYTSGDALKDPETRRLWHEAQRALDALETYLRDKTGLEF